MRSKKAKSKKRSATRESYAEQLKEAVFFVDRSSGKFELVNGLRNLGLSVERHDDHFDENTQDPAWISACGQHNWIIVSSDKAIKRNTLERLAIMSSGAAAFFFTSPEITSTQQVEAFEKALPGITRMILGQPRPFIARISQDGTVELWLNHKGEDVLARKLEIRKAKKLKKLQRN